ncbi:MAG: Tetratricopeptide TPR_2 repeat protein [Parcubacteria group bacterium GW2011_GWA2_47_26]|nr:MAG: Tetratricopeptide TPR_2 repeat protein [Parcubacteria group bacterium GW2011_GWA2_47_26]
MPTKNKVSAAHATRTVKPRKPASKFKKIAKAGVEPKPAESWYYELKQAPAETVPASQTVVRPLTEQIDSQPASRGKHWSWQSIFLSVAVIVFPLFAMPWALETHEFFKQMLLSVLVGIGLICVFGVAARRGTLNLLPRNIFVPLGILSLAAILVSALKSDLRYSAFFGYGGQESLAFISFVLLGLWTLIVFAMVRKDNSRSVYFALILSAALLSVVTILALAGQQLYLWINSAGWNPAGTTTTVGIIAAIGVVLGSGLFLQSATLRQSFSSFFLILPLLILLIGIDFTVAWIVLAVGLVLLLLTARKNMGRRLLPISLFLVLALAQAILPLKTDFFSTPLEVGPSHQETWSIVRQTLKVHPILGSGPATFGAEYLKYRSAPILQTPFWNVVFEWGSSGALTILGNLGWVGGGLLLLTVLFVLFNYGSRLIKSREEAARDRIFGAGIFSAAAALLIGVFLAPMSLSLVFLLSTLLGLMLVELKRYPWSVFQKLRLGTAGGQRNLGISLAGTAILLFVFFILFVQGRRVPAEFFATSAAGQANISLDNAYALMERAEHFDSWNDTYSRMSADIQRLVLRTNLAAAAKPDQDQKELAEEVRRMTDGIIQSAKRATMLAPGVALNWSALGSFYLDIAPFVSGAAQAALDAFNKARDLNPNDPSLLVNIGIAQSLSFENQAGAEQSLRRAAEIRPDYIFAHLELARLLGQRDKTEEALAEYRRAEKIQPNDPALKYEIGLFLLSRDRKEAAQRELEGAVNLASNFSNARWYLSQIYEESGAIERAIEEMQKVVKQNTDSQQAKDRLAELQNKLSGD